MNDERRYEDHEIREVLDLAIREDQGPMQVFPAVDGLTLRELQEVGRELGVSAARVAQAVAAFEGRGLSLPRGSTLGMPTSVGRVIPLNRDPTEREWELLIAELRATFGGKGEVARTVRTEVESTPGPGSHATIFTLARTRKPH